MAAQPPRPPPNNLLFCGPPPALPHVLLLPSDAACANNDLQVQLHTGDSQTNDADALHEINNVGVPTYDGIFHDQVQVFDDNQNIEYQLPPESYLRRTHSFDVSDIYAAQIVSEIDPSAFRHRRSEPDLSKYGLFAEVTMECAPEHLQPPPLVLNNPFYDGTYAMDPHQLNHAMVVLPENYLAFEDSFVPTAWDYKPEFLIDREMNSEMFYDGLPLIPSNDPWSVYCNDNAAFEYYSPHYEAPLGEDGIHYTPLTDLDYAIPQYMSLPVAEQPKTEDDYMQNNNYIVEEANIPSANEIVTQIQNNDADLQKSDVPTSDDVVKNESNVVSEDEKVSAMDSSTNRESSSQSEESFNADISNDVTSSLAFIPSSKSSQRPNAGEDTSDDTSPCSTDYHEASALDLVQSLDELSCCDSTDYSQSRDDVSPIIPDIPKASNAVITEHPNVNIVPVVSNTIPLNQLPSIPLHDQPTQLPPVQNSLPEKETVKTNVKLEQVSQCAASETNKKIVNVVKPEVTKTSETAQCRTNQQLAEPCARDNNVKVNDNALKISQKPPVPPAVPTSWLAPRPAASGHQTNVVHPPQIRVQNAEGVVTDLPKSPKVASQPPAKTQQLVAEPQPSCSFTPQQPVHASQLKPEKQTKEVEVSPHIIIVH